MIRMVCNHKDGWILKEEIVVNLELDNDNLEGEFVCNHLGCGEKKVFKFDVVNLEEVTGK